MPKDASASAVIIADNVRNNVLNAFARSWGAQINHQGVGEMVKKANLEGFLKFGTDPIKPYLDWANPQAFAPIRGFKCLAFHRAPVRL